MIVIHQNYLFVNRSILYFTHVRRGLIRSISYCMSVTISMSWNLFFSFFILHHSRDLKTEESDISRLSRKILVCMEMDKMGPRWNFFEFHEILSSLFAETNLQWKTLKSSVFLCRLHIWENSCPQVMGQNTFVQSDCSILPSSISVDVMQSLI